MSEHLHNNCWTPCENKKKSCENSHTRENNVILFVLLCDSEQHFLVCDKYVQAFSQNQHWKAGNVERFSSDRVLCCCSTRGFVKAS